ncbi:DNA primase [Candidatus Poriferisodalis sp.]|uniref:DNA primase n=1 Tax=Candidatus Poriferisodalis sp. TaxID=3101277 RepID=UPI003B02BD21
MSIRDSDVQRVREATDLVALIGRRVSLKRVGSRHVGLCPFHTEKTPSFSVDPAKGFYHCFGCEASGDAFTFLRETEHLGFNEAVEQLAAAANITLTYDDPGAQRANQRRKELIDLLEKAARFYHERLMNGSDAGPARAYLRRRGYDRDTVVKWRLGYAPPRWDELCRHLGVPPEQVAAAGLAYAEAGRARAGPRRGTGRPGSEAGAIGGTAVSDELGNTSGDEPEGGSDDESAGDDATDRDVSSASDFFRDRIMFPICDASGRVVSFAGRLLPRPDESTPTGPKYKNTAGTVVYDKSKVLYGLHLAKQPARKADRVVVCEGYTDVIGCDLAGIAEAVATCGTALTQQHAELLSRSAKRIVLAFDADAAGQTATERVHQWEREYGLDVFVAAFPAGSDPGDLAESNPPALRRALEEAQPLHAFRAERILQRAELDSPGGRDRAADEAAEVLAVYPDDVLGETDLEPIARRIPMAVEDLRRRVAEARVRLADRPASERPRHVEPPPPPDPGDDYFEADYNTEWEPAHQPSAEVEAPSLARRVQVQIDQSNRHRAMRERLLLEAAMAPEGDAVSLISPELFFSDIAREAFSRIVAQQVHDEGGVMSNAPVAADSALPLPDESDDSVRALIEAAAAGGKKLSSSDALRRVADELRHYVADTIRRIGDGTDVPFAVLASAASDAERYHHRRGWLRWLRERDIELRDPRQQAGAAPVVAKWIQGEFATATTGPSEELPAS